MRLQDKVALVTGATQGIGQAIALRLAQEGARVAVNSLQDDDRAAAMRERIGSLGRRCATVIGDVSVPAAMRAVFEGAIGELGPIGILVNNAGIQRRDAFGDVTEATTNVCWRSTSRGLLSEPNVRRDVPSPAAKGGSSTSARCTRNFHFRTSHPTA